MPHSPPHYCAHVGCNILVQGGTPGGRCPAHTLAPWRPRVQPVPRIRGEKLQHLRAQLFMRTPLCVLCEQHGRITMATIRDHIVPLADGGTEDDSNTQALCWTCNELKRQTEAKSGRAKQAKVTTG